MNKIFVVEFHDQVLDLWRAQKIASRQVVHLDFHCDLSGMLIDRQTPRAYRIWERFPNVHEGNFLKHAILEGLISGVEWIHDEPGGRQHDLKTVKYESDLTAIFHRCILALRRDQGIPVRYKVILNAEWTTLKPGEILDVDWDFFACKQYPVDTIPQRVDSFLSRSFSSIPQQTYVCYSPDYSHQTRELFRRFIDDLAVLFQAEVVDILTPTVAPARKSLYDNSAILPWFRAARHIYRQASLALRKRGIY